jgi:hypothetical protein
MARALTSVLIILIIPCLVGAGNWPIPCPDQSHIELTYPALMTTCPAGDGPAFEHVQVFAVTKDGDPIEGLPSSQFFFTIDGNVTVTPVEQATDENGRIRFTMTSDESLVRLDPDWMHIECRIATVALNDVDSLQVNTLDLNTDGCISDEDATVFRSLYLSEDPRADFSRDGAVDMKDASVLTRHIGHCAPDDEEETEESDPAQQPVPDQTITPPTTARKVPAADDED